MENNKMGRFLGHSVETLSAFL